MNLIDLGILVVLGLFVLHGFHKGFLIGVLGTGCFFLSWLLAILISPALSRTILSNETLKDAMLYYTEGSEKLASVEYYRLDVGSLSTEQLEEIVGTADLEAPLDEIIHSNMAAEVFRSENITTVGDYFNQSMVYFAVNTISFIIVFLLVRIALAFVIGAVDNLRLIPTLTHFDGLMGAGVGFINGFFMLFVVFMVAPLILTVLPFPEITDYIDGSFFGSFFYNANFLLSLIKGTA